MGHSRVWEDPRFDGRNKELFSPARLQTWLVETLHVNVQGSLLEGTGESGGWDGVKPGEEGEVGVTEGGGGEEGRELEGGGREGRLAASSLALANINYF